MADPNKKADVAIDEVLNDRLEDLEKYLKAIRGEHDDEEEEMIDCDRCDGTGKIECEEGEEGDSDECDDEGMMDCPICDGGGQVDNPDYVEPMSAGEAETELSEYALSMEVKRFVDVDLSTGGPYDYIRYFIDGSNEVEFLEYHYGWGGDSAVRTYRSGSKFDTLVAYYDQQFKEALP